MEHLHQNDPATTSSRPDTAPTGADAATTGPDAERTGLDIDLATTETTDRRRTPGRPRNEEAERAILEAALELTGEVGVANMTVEAVARRAGVGKATIYRRWPTKPAMVLAAFVELLEPAPVPDTGTVRGDLRVYQHDFVRMLVGPSRDTVPHLAAEAMSDEEMRRTLSKWVASRRAVVRTVLIRGVDRGELRSDLDVDLALELFSGPLVYRTTFAGLPIDEQVADALVDLVVDGLGA